MQRDFHFYTVYALLRAAGWSSADAKIVAYASQYTDDAKDGTEIPLGQGKSFNRALTAYSALRPQALTTRVQEEVYASFHFLPGPDPESDDIPRGREALKVTANSSLARKLVRQALDCGPDDPIRRHRLGIALHSYADTFSIRDSRVFRDRRTMWRRSGSRDGAPSEGSSG